MSGKSVEFAVEGGEDGLDEILKSQRRTYALVHIKYDTTSPYKIHENVCLVVRHVRTQGPESGCKHTRRASEREINLPTFETLEQAVLINPSKTLRVCLAPSLFMLSN